MKKFLSLLLAFVMVISIFTVVPIEADAVDTDVAITSAVSGDFTYSISGGTATIEKVDYYIKGDVKIPSELAGCTVVCIDDEAFRGCSRMTSVTIPYGVRKIGYQAFDECYSLKSISIPSSVNYIGGSAFSRTSIQSITIPNGVTSIKGYTFEFCRSLSNITIPDSVESIGNFAFSYCTSLKSVTVPKGVKSIGRFAFRCTELRDVTFLGEETEIGESAFSECTYLSDVTMPNGIKSIGQYAFQECNSLYSVDLSNGIKTIGYGAFKDCYCLSSVILPEDMELIDAYAFSGCKWLSSISLPDSLTAISAGVFSSCSNLSKVYIPNGVDSIGASAFAFCSDLGVVYIPDTVKRIESKAFSNCISLDTIYIPDSVESIEENAFDNCTALKTVSVPTRSCFTELSFDESTTVYIRDEEGETVLDKDKLSIFIGKIPVYNGFKQTPEIKVYYDGKMLDNEYFINYSNNIEAGNDAVAEVVGVGEYSSLKKNFKFSILPMDVEGNLKVSVVSYSSSPDKCELEVETVDGKSLTEHVDYEKTITKTAAGNEVLIHILGKGNYAGVYTQVHKINSNDLTYELIGGGKYDGQVFYGPLDLDFTIGYTGQYNYISSYSIHVNNKSYDTSDTLVLTPGTYEIYTYVSLALRDHVYDYVYVDGSGKTIYVNERYEIIRSTSYSSHSTVVVEDAQIEVNPIEPVFHSSDTIFLGLNFYSPYIENIRSDVQWVSSDPSVATVVNGVVTLHKVGNATIVAKTDFGTVSWDLGDIQALDISKNSTVLKYIHLTNKATVLWKDEILDEGEDYTISVGDVDDLTVVTIEGKNLFTGSIKKYYYLGTNVEYYMPKIGDTDGDGDINIMDATAIQLHVAKIKNLTIDEQSVADTDKDGEISVMDATQIQMFVAKLIPEL